MTRRQFDNLHAGDRVYDFRTGAPGIVVAISKGLVRVQWVGGFVNHYGPVDVRRLDLQPTLFDQVVR